MQKGMPHEKRERKKNCRERDRESKRLNESDTMARQRKESEKCQVNQEYEHTKITHNHNKRRQPKNNMDAYEWLQIMEQDANICEHVYTLAYFYIFI